MRRAVLLAVALTGIATATWVDEAGAPTYKPVRLRRVSAPPAATVDDFAMLWNRSSAIVEGLVERVNPVVAAADTARSRVRVRVLDVFKRDPHVPARGESLDVLMAGAITDRGDHIEAAGDPDAPLLARPQRPILFLSWDADLRCYALATQSHDSVFLVDGAAVASTGRQGVAREIEALSHGQLALRLRHWPPAN